MPDPHRVQGTGKFAGQNAEKRSSFPCFILNFLCALCGKSSFLGKIIHSFGRNTYFHQAIFNYDLISNPNVRGFLHLNCFYFAIKIL